MTNNKTYVRFGIATAVIVLSLGYLAFTGVQESKSYYVTIKELRQMGDEATSKRLRVAGNVAPGSIRPSGTHAEFDLMEEGRLLHVDYRGSEPPPDTFKDNAQAMAEGTYGRDGIFHAKQLQAKCASKYAPAATGQAGMSQAKNSEEPIQSRPMTATPAASNANASSAR